jgi:hypothetical protein
MKTGAGANDTATIFERNRTAGGGVRPIGWNASEAIHLDRRSMARHHR